MPRVSKRRQALAAAAASKQLAQMNREKDADAAANIKKLQWGGKGRHLNICEKQCVLRAYYNALAQQDLLKVTDRIHPRAARAAGKALMLPPGRVSSIVHSWKKYGGVRTAGRAKGSAGRASSLPPQRVASNAKSLKKHGKFRAPVGTGRSVRRGATTDKVAQEKEEQEEDGGEGGGNADDDDEEEEEEDGFTWKQSDSGSGGGVTRGKPKIVKPLSGEEGGAMGWMKRKRVEKRKEPPDAGSPVI
eukprot:g6020.t1